MWCYVLAERIIIMLLRVWRHEVIEGIMLLGFWNGERGKKNSSLHEECECSRERGGHYVGT